MAPIADNVSFAAAAALPVAGLTALRTLRHGAPLLGKRVLITGAAGGVGQPRDAARRAFRRAGHGRRRQPGARPASSTGSAPPRSSTDIEQARGPLRADPRSRRRRLADGGDRRGSRRRARSSSSAIRRASRPRSISAISPSTRTPAFRRSHYFTSESRGPLRARSGAARLAGRRRLAEAALVERIRLARPQPDRPAAARPADRRQSRISHRTETEETDHDDQSRRQDPVGDAALSDAGRRARRCRRDEFFAGKKVALFGCPGAYTRTCSQRHLPGYVHECRRAEGQGDRHDRLPLGQRRRS